MRADGERFEAEITTRPARVQDGRAIGFVNTIRDVSVQKRHQRELERLARTDSLTQLANRLRAAGGAGARGRRRRGDGDGRQLALVLLDLDLFKQVNDALGHPAGDAVLIEVARRLERTVRAGEVLARVGGEEFAWLLPASSADEAIAAADRARAAIASRRSGAPARLTMSAGVGAAAHAVRRRRASTAWPTALCTRPSRAAATAPAVSHRPRAEPALTGWRRLTLTQALHRASVSTWRTLRCAGALLDALVDELQLVDHRLGERERVQVIAPHAAVDGVERVGERQPVVEHLGEAPVPGLGLGSGLERAVERDRSRAAHRDAVLGGRLQRVADVEVVGERLGPVLPRVHGRVCADVALRPVAGRPLGVVAIQRRGVVGALVAEQRPAGAPIADRRGRGAAGSSGRARGGGGRAASGRARPARCAAALAWRRRTRPGRS